MWIHKKPLWAIDRRDTDQREPTAEHVFRRRREFLRQAGFAGLGLLGLQSAGAQDASKKDEPKLYPARRNDKFTVDRPLTDEKEAARYNNFYEFSFGKEAPARLAQKLVVRPWTIEVTGLCAKPRTFDIDDLLKRMPLEERIYRFRCVEAWAMTVPWTGFPLSRLLDEVEPSSSAKYVRFLTFFKPEWAPNQRSDDYPWPYFEGLTLAEARHDLTLLVTGAYGKPMANQHGAPIRLMVPWKYGFKSCKSIVKIELLEKEPATFWNTLVPSEYDFVANVNPAVPHPRWSQASERMLGTGERRPTLPYNGYGELVAKLYS